MRRPTTIALLVPIIALAPGSTVAEVFRIEIDYMVEGGPGGHSHMPQPDEILAVQNMFACQGHTLIVEVGDVLNHYDALAVGSNPDAFFSYDAVPNTFKVLKDANFDHAGEPGWHYCIFAHQYESTAGNPTSSSGLGEVRGDDFIVTLGSFSGEIGTPFDRAATLAHEFGHNLGLEHCGDMNCGRNSGASNFVGPRPPNVPSVMSYFYQLTGVRTNLLCQGLVPDELAFFRDIDYSHGRMCNIDETALDETVGIGLVGVDWNCSGTIGGIFSQDLNENAQSWCNGTGQMTLLSDYDEWANIQDVTKYTPAKLLENVPIASCITAEEWEEVRSKVACSQPALAVEGCVSTEMMYVSPAGDSSPNGRCSDPFASVAVAHANNPGETTLIVEPGTYDEAGSLVLYKSLRLHSRGTVVLK